MSLTVRHQGPTPAGGAQPLRAVLDAVAAGAGSVGAAAASTGLPVDVVRAALDHLERLGRISVERLPFGCPGGGCGSCALATAAGSGCDARTPGEGVSGPVLVTITLR